MGHHKALVVGGRSPATDDLRSALAEGGIPVSVIAPHVTDRDLVEAARDAGIVLVSARVSDAELRALGERVTASVGRDAPIVVYADDDHDGLDRHVRAGADYVLPPFRSDILRRRLAGHNAEGIEAVADAAHLAQYERELEIGREIQGGFLPDRLPTPDGWQIEVRFRPARQVAGDFYDAFELVGGRRIGFVVADVCDKGVGAALFMALIRSLLRNTAGHAGSLSVLGLDVDWEEAADPAQGPRPSATSAGIGPLLNAVTWTDRYMVENHLRQGYFATLFFGLLDPVSGTVVYVNCGHNPPLVRRRDGAVVRLEPTGPALGMLPGARFRLGWVQLGPGDLLFAYTDGVPEAKDEAGRFFTDQGMRDVLAEPGAADARSLLNLLDAALDAHVGSSERFDDITMMALHRAEEPLVARVVRR
jgi:sigma-B regulation protein RsbU (phosphoserine phosphatase)